MLRLDVNYHVLPHCSVFLRPWWDTFNLRVTQMSALNLSPTFPEGSSPTWIMTSRFRRRGFVHKRLYLCRRGTNLARHLLFFFPGLYFSSRLHLFTNLGWYHWLPSHNLLFSRNSFSMDNSSHHSTIWIPFYLTAWSLCSNLQLASKVTWMPAFIFFSMWGILSWDILHFFRWWRHTGGVYYKATAVHFGVHT